MPDIAPATPERLDRHSILAAIEKIDSNYQAVIALFYLEDHSYPEIAEILEIPLGTVKSRISRGITQLQSLLAPTAVETKRGEVSHG